MSNRVHDWLLSTWGLNLQEPLWLIAGLSTLILLIAYGRFRRRREQMTFKSRRQEKATLPNRRDREIGRHLAVTMILIAIIGLSIPASRPIIDSQTVEDYSLISWIIDVSESMGQEDVVSGDDQTISRLEGVIESLNRTYDRTPSNSLKQVITFSDEDSVTVGELVTTDAELSIQIANLAEIAPKNATATEFGLRAARDSCAQAFDAITKLDRETDNRSESQARPIDRNNLPCTLILLSDGECSKRSCKADSVAAAAEANSRGMTVHAVSWGDPDADKRTAHVPDRKTMGQIAVAGGGIHLETNDTDQLVSLYQDAFDQLQPRTVYQELFWGVVWGARALIGLLILVFYLTCLRNQDLLIRRSR